MSYFYQVLVSSSRFHGQTHLTYSSDQSLPIGSIVQVPLRNEAVAGLIIANDQPATFKVKPISRLITTTALPPHLLDLLGWLQQYYPAPLANLVQLILPSSLAHKRLVQNPEPALAANLHRSPEPLTSEQQSAIDQLAKAKAGTALIHGDTGTGKTRLYIELAAQALQAGQSVLILTPEIGLTPQLYDRLSRGLNYPVIAWHSNLSPAQRRDVWLQILQAPGPIVVVGPRSALFAPLAKVGLIVLDEVHDQAYKQEQSPHYQTSRVAAQLARLHKAKLILGSATPLVTDYYLAQIKQRPIIRLTERPAGLALERAIEVINLREKKQFQQSPHLSNRLLKHIKHALDHQQQALVFLNRRGTARLVLCQQCGWMAQCSHCDLPLTYHRDQHLLRCHTCGYQQASFSSCPNCHSTDIIFKAIGTKAIVTELQKHFPQAKIRRFDTDNLKTERLEHHYQDILNGQVDILVGTQLLTKGLDLPKLAVAGVVIADSSLYFPDYTAEERTYQLLTQLIGRVGRGHINGKVVIQTYSPDSPIIQAAVQQNWSQFYNNQLSERRIYGFPPFYHYLKLSCVRQTSNGAQLACQKLMNKIQQSDVQVKLVGPSPSFYERQGGKFRWQIIAKAKNRGDLLKIIPLLPANWHYDLDPNSLL